METIIKSKHGGKDTQEIPGPDRVEVESISKRIKFSSNVKTTSSIVHPAERISTYESIESARQRIEDALLDAQKMLRTLQTKRIQSATETSQNLTRFINPWTKWNNKEDRIFRWKHAGSGQI